VHVHQRRAIPYSKEKTHKRPITSRECTSKKGNTMVKRKKGQKSNDKPCMYIKEGQYHGQKKNIHKRAITSRACTSTKGNTMVKRKKHTKGQIMICKKTNTTEN
jgi:hypothetical protein